MSDEKLSRREGESSAKQARTTVEKLASVTSFDDLFNLFNTRHPGQARKLEGMIQGIREEIATYINFARSLGGKEPINSTEIIQSFESVLKKFASPLKKKICELLEQEIKKLDTEWSPETIGDVIIKSLRKKKLALAHQGIPEEAMGKELREEAERIGREQGLKDQEMLRRLRGEAEYYAFKAETGGERTKRENKEAISTEKRKLELGEMREAIKQALAEAQDFDQIIAIIEKYKKDWIEITAGGYQPEAYIEYVGYMKPLIALLQEGQIVPQTIVNFISDHIRYSERIPLKETVEKLSLTYLSEPQREALNKPSWLRNKLRYESWDELRKILKDKKEGK